MATTIREKPEIRDLGPRPTNGALKAEPVPSAREIERKALTHTVWTLGDCIRVEEPTLEEGGWKVVLRSEDATEEIGALYFDLSGVLDESRSTTRATLG